MQNDDPISVVNSFNNCINRQDIEALSGLMSDDHIFIDSSGEVRAGKGTMVAGWKQFFKDYPDYLNHFKHIQARGNLVIVAGYSTCSFEALDGPALWRAKVSGGLIKEWHVYDDTDANRLRLDLHI